MDKADDSDTSNSTGVTFSGAGNNTGSTSLQNVLLNTRGYTITVNSDLSTEAAYGGSGGSGHQLLSSNSGGALGSGDQQLLRSGKSSDILELPEGYTADVPLSRTESRFPSLDEIVHDSTLGPELGILGEHLDVQTALLEDGEQRCNSILKLSERARESPEWALSLAKDTPMLSTATHWFRVQLHTTATLLLQPLPPVGDLQCSTASASTHQPDVAAYDTQLTTAAAKQLFAEEGGRTKDAAERLLEPVESLASCSAMLKLFIVLCPLAADCPVQLASTGMLDALLNEAPKLNREILIAQSDRYTALPSAGKADWRQSQIRLLRRRALMLLCNIAVGHTDPQALWQSAAITDSLGNLSALASAAEADLLFAVLHNLTTKLSDAVLLEWFKLPTTIATIFTFYRRATVVQPNDTAALQTQSTTTTALPPTAAAAVAHDFQLVEACSSSGSWLTVFGLRCFSRCDGDLLNSLLAKCLSLLGGGGSASSRRLNSPAVCSTLLTHLETLLDVQHEEVAVPHKASDQPAATAGASASPVHSSSHMSQYITRYVTTQPNFHRTFNHILTLTYDWLQLQFDLNFKNAIRTTGTDSVNVKCTDGKGFNNIMSGTIDVASKKCYVFPELPELPKSEPNWTANEIAEFYDAVHNAYPVVAVPVVVQTIAEANNTVDIPKFEPPIAKAFFNLMSSLTAHLQTLVAVQQQQPNMLCVLYDAIGERLLTVCVAAIKLITAVEIQLAAAACTSQDGVAQDRVCAVPSNTVDKNRKNIVTIDGSSPVGATGACPPSLDAHYRNLYNLRCGMSVKSLLLCIANLCSDRPHAQSAIERVDGLAAVLSRTRISTVEPLQRESAIFAVKAICNGHSSNLSKLKELLALSDTGATELSKPQDFGLP